MSNSLALAAVTATLRNVLQAAVNTAADAIGNVRVTNFNPADKKGDKPFVNVFLYHVTPNAALRNVDLPTRTSSGALLARPEAALNLHYLITCAGDDSLFEPQRMLGIVTSTLQAQPMLSRDLIRQSIKTLIAGDANLAFLNGSDLADAVDLVKLRPEHLSTEEMSKIWSVFFQVPYVLSVSYIASAVLIDRPAAPRTPLPVRTRGAYVIAAQRPNIDAVGAQADETAAAGTAPAPIVDGTALYVRGTNLNGDDVHVLFGGTDVAIPIADRTAERIAVTLPAVPAGVLGVVVAQRIPMGTPPVAHSGASSNVFPIVVRPQITAPPTKANASSRVLDGATVHSVDLTLTLTPAIGVSQRVSLLLNEHAASPAPPAHAYTFDAPARIPGVDPPTSPTITVRVKDVLPGTYTMRALVDGAESVPVGGIANPYPEIVLP